MSPLRGILLKLASVSVFVVMAALIKATAAHVPPGQAVFFRSFFAIPVIFAWLALRHELKGGIRVQDPMGHVWRGVVGTTAMGLGFAGLGLLPLPFGWVVPTAREAALLVAAGLCGGVGQILLTSSYRHADASVVAPFEYASILMAIGIGYAVFGEVPTLAMLAGASLVILAGVLIIWREHRLGLERARQRGSMTPQG